MKQLIFLSFLLSGCGGRTPVTPIDNECQQYVDSIAQLNNTILILEDIIYRGGK